jgi:hypothetical protein
MLAVFASPLRAGDSCNPVVDPVASDTTLQRTLSRLADEFEFKLSLPESLDRPVNFEQSMALDRLVKHLTRDMNTILKHKKVDGCDKPVLSQLIVLPVGKESGYVGNQQAEQEQPVEYIYIEDMESYVTSVLEGKQQADLGPGMRIIPGTETRTLQARRPQTHSATNMKRVRGSGF